MAETTTLRLMAAAKEFNIGKDTLVDFLVSKGFSKDDLKPTSKLTEDMYRSLQQEFNSDKVAKHKSDQIDLPKGSLEAKKKKEEEAQQPAPTPTPLFKKDAPPVTKKPAKEEAPPVVEETPAPPPPPPVVEPVREEPEVVKIEAPELEGPKVVTKIDLSAIDSSTRPKKVAKKEEPVVESVPEEPVKPAKEPAPQPEPPVSTPVAVEEPPVVEKEEPVRAVATEEKAEPEQQAIEEAGTESDVPPVIENIRAEKIEGPKILGKIDLPVNSDTRPKAPSEEKRKRKRIPIEKRDAGH